MVTRIALRLREPLTPVSYIDHRESSELAVCPYNNYPTLYTRTVMISYHANRWSPQTLSQLDAMAKMICNAQNPNHSVLHFCQGLDELDADDMSA